MAGQTHQHDRGCSYRQYPAAHAALQEWVDSVEGVPLPLQCVMDLLANLYNTGGWLGDWMACWQRGLVRTPSMDCR